MNTSRPRHLRLGVAGEALAKRYLLRLGWSIIGENIRLGKKEIDLIALDRGVTVFVEVKTRSGEAFGQPEEAITDQKLALLHAAIAQYARTHAIKEARLDVIAIVYLPEKKPKVKHLRGISEGSPLAFLP